MNDADRGEPLGGGLQMETSLYNNHLFYSEYILFFLLLLLILEGIILEDSEKNCKSRK